MTSALTFTLPAPPKPGEVIAHTVGRFTMLVEDTGADDSCSSEFSPCLSYEAVDVRGGTRVHAAEVTHHPKQSVVSRWALCSVTRTRFRVINRRRDDDLGATVTCSRCRRRLQKAGLL